MLRSPNEIPDPRGARRPGHRPHDRGSLRADLPFDHVRPRSRSGWPSVGTPTFASRTRPRTSSRRLSQLWKAGRPRSSSRPAWPPASRCCRRLRRGRTSSSPMTSTTATGPPPKTFFPTGESPRASWTCLTSRRSRRRSGRRRASSGWSRPPTHCSRSRTSAPLRSGPAGRRSLRPRQHVRDADPPASDRARGRRRPALDDEVFRRAQRRPGRRADLRAPGRASRARREGRSSSARSRSGRFAVQLLARAARPAHPRLPSGGAERGRAGCRQGALRLPAGLGGPLSRVALQPGA